MGSGHRQGLPIPFHSLFEVKTLLLYKSVKSVTDFKAAQPIPHQKRMGEDPL